MLTERYLLALRLTSIKIWEWKIVWTIRKYLRFDLFCLIKDHINILKFRYSSIRKAVYYHRYSTLYIIWILLRYSWDLSLSKLVLLWVPQLDLCLQNLYPVTFSILFTIICALEQSFLTFDYKLLRDVPYTLTSSSWKCFFIFELVDTPLNGLRYIFIDNLSLIYLYYIQTLFKLLLILDLYIIKTLLWVFLVLDISLDFSAKVLEIYLNTVLYRISDSTPLDFY